MRICKECVWGTLFEDVEQDQANEWSTNECGNVHVRDCDPGGNIAFDTEALLTDPLLLGFCTAWCGAHLKRACRRTKSFIDYFEYGPCLQTSYSAFGFLDPTDIAKLRAVARGHMDIELPCIVKN